MYKIIFASLIAILLFSGTDCKHEPPTKEEPPKPDTTSQEFEITTQELGVNGPTSFLKDVWIFSSQNIWAVGDVYMPLDSQGLTYKEYNIVQWNGIQWEGAGYLFNSGGVESLWALDSSTIYFAAGYLFKYSRGVFTEFDITNLNIQSGQRVEKLWGTSEQNIWGAGRNGMVVHYNGSEWKKVDFPLGWNFRSITGSKTTGVAYAVADSLGVRGFIRCEKDSAQIVKRIYPPNGMVDVALFNEQTLWWCGVGVGEFDIVTRDYKVLQEFPGVSQDALALNANNDIYIFGENVFTSKQLMIHYNGKQYKTIELPMRSYVNEGGAFAINNLAFMVAKSNDKAYIISVQRKP